MKRSEVNANLRWAVELLDRYQFKLPRFAYWSMAEWKENIEWVEVSEEETIDLDELEDMFPDDFCGV